MTTPDLINGLFEAGGGFINWLNVNRLYNDKQVRGVSIWVWLWFTSWGLWNLYYYPHLNQIMSMVGALILVLSNATWLGLALWYTLKWPIEDAGPR